MGNRKVFDNATKRVNNKKKMLTRNEEFKKKHLVWVKKITNKKLEELKASEKTAEEKLTKNKKAIQENIDKKTKAFQNANKAYQSAKGALNKAIAEKENKVAIVKLEYNKKTTKIGEDINHYRRKYQQVVNPSNNHLLYGKSRKANIKRDKMATFLVTKMYYDPQTTLQGISRQFIANQKIQVPNYQPNRLKNMYRVGARSAYNTLQSGKFKLPVNLYNKSGKLKPYKIVAKELKNLRPKPMAMNVNAMNVNAKKPNVSKKNNTKKAPAAAAPAAAPQSLPEATKENMLNGAIEDEYQLQF
jgi:hypothetical protein